MYSDIVPPKKKNFINEKRDDHEVRMLKSEKVYHTIDRYHEKSRWPIILSILTIVILAVVYYSVFNNKTRISFESKSTIFEIQDNIPMNLSEKTQNGSTTLGYNLIYNNADKERNIFAPAEEIATTTATTPAPKAEEYYVINSATTSSDSVISKKVIFVNQTGASVQLVKNTRVDVAGVTYYLEKNIDIKKSAATTTPSTGYKIIGFKGTAKYEKFYATDYTDVANNTEIITTPTEDNKNAPNTDILSLIPENFIPLRKNYVFDKNINQGALVVVDKRDFERVLLNNSNVMKEYVKTFKSVSDLVEYEININDYELQLDSATGLPTGFKNLTIEIIPRIKRDRVASVFKGFSKDTMKKIKLEISKNINMEVRYSPFWVSAVADEDHISVEVK